MIIRFDKSINKTNFFKFMRCLSPSNLVILVLLKFNSSKFSRDSKPVISEIRLFDKSKYLKLVR